jgi:Spy/CpxP family protein refolding chaperone
MIDGAAEPRLRVAGSWVAAAGIPMLGGLARAGVWPLALIFAARCRLPPCFSVGRHAANRERPRPLSTVSGSSPMKTFLCAVGCAFALTAVVPAAAQDRAAAQLTSAEWLAKIQSNKKGIVEKSMDLTPEEAKKFWPLYDAFQRELALPQSSITRAVNDYIAAGQSVTDANARRLTEQVLSATRDEARLHEKHFKQLLKVLPARKAARYIQIENKVDAVVRYESAKAIPLVD